jgi:hypothetical protein
MTLEQTRRMREIAAKACIKFGENYEEVCYAAEEAIIVALADPLLTGEDLTKFEPDWVDYRSGFDCGYAEAKEDAAKVCDSEATCEGIAQKCAAAIRAMKKEEK